MPIEYFESTVTDRIFAPNQTGISSYLRQIVRRCKLEENDEFKPAGRHPDIYDGTFWGYSITYDQSLTMIEFERFPVAI